MKSKNEENQQHNPRAKAAFLEAVSNQLRANDPPEAKQTLDRLVSEGFSVEDAKIYIAQALCVEIWDTLHNEKPYNRERYIRNLERLPEEPTE